MSFCTVLLLFEDFEVSLFNSSILVLAFVFVAFGIYCGELSRDADSFEDELMLLGTSFDVSGPGLAEP